MRHGRSQSTAVRDPGSASRVGPRPAGPRVLRGRAATMIAALALIGTALAFLAVQNSVPSSATHLRPGGAALLPAGLALSPLGASALQEGDVLVSIDGVPVHALARGILGALSGPEEPVWTGSSGTDPALTLLRTRWRAGARMSFEVLRNGVPADVGVELTSHPLLAAALRTWGTILFAVVTIVVASLVFARRPDHAPARVLFVGAAALVAATTWSLGLRPADFVLPVGFWLFQLTTVAAFMIYWTSLFHFTLVFPRRLALASTPGAVPALYALPFAVVGGYLTVQALHADTAWALLATVPPVTGPHAAVFLGATLATITWQYRTTRSGAQRRQIQWVVLAGLVAGTAGLIFYILPPLVGAAPMSPNLIGAIVTTFPVAIAIAVLRHQLFDIDTILHRALVYGLLMFVVAGLYVAVVGVLGSVLPARAGRLPSLVATLAAAVVFQPVRDRIQRRVNRWLYGERDEPATILARLGARLEGTLAPEDVLPTLAQTVAQALKLPYVAIDLGLGPDARVAAEFGKRGEDLDRYPLTYRGRKLGTLVLNSRSEDEPHAANETMLLETIARQASVAAYAVQATADLRRSRERLVVAREEERRRLRRDLHDGVGPALAALALKLDATANVVGEDAETAKKLLADLRDQVQGAIDELRRLVHALRPPALDDLGLLGALREHARRWNGGGLAIVFDTPPALPSIPAATELAAYRIVHEALANVVRHAGAERCRIALRVGADLEVFVEDDGCGISQTVARGVGLASMRERAEELGGVLRVGAGRDGGTRVCAVLPLELER